MVSLLKWTASDKFGKLIDGRRICDQVNAHLLAAATDEADTPPAGASVVVISTNLTLYIKMNGAAAVPAADVTDGTASEYLPPGSKTPFVLDGVATIHMIGIGAETPIVTLSYYA